MGHEPCIRPIIGGSFSLVCSRCGRRLTAGVFDLTPCLVPPPPPTIHERDAQFRRVLPSPEATQ